MGKIEVVGSKECACLECGEHGTCYDIRMEGQSIEFLCRKCMEDNYALVP